MLTLLTKNMRRRAALVLGALFFVCSAAPGVALSFADAKSAAHCITDNHHDVKKHSHDGGSSHAESDAGSSAPSSDEPANSSGSCCGLFCISAVETGPIFTLDNTIEPATPPAWPERNVASNQLAGVDRPPKVLLSF